MDIFRRNLLEAMQSGAKNIAATQLGTDLLEFVRQFAELSAYSGGLTASDHVRSKEEERAEMSQATTCMASLHAAILLDGKLPNQEPLLGSSDAIAIIGAEAHSRLEKMIHNVAPYYTISNASHCHSAVKNDYSNFLMESAQQRESLCTENNLPLNAAATFFSTVHRYQNPHGGGKLPENTMLDIAARREGYNDARTFVQDVLPRHNFTGIQGHTLTIRSCNSNNQDDIPPLLLKIYEIPHITTASGAAGNCLAELLKALVEYGNEMINILKGMNNSEASAKDREDASEEDSDDDSADDDEHLKSDNDGKTGGE